MITLDVKTQQDFSAEIAQRMRQRRRERGFTQAELAVRSGVSLGSLKRFECQHEISLTSLVKLAMALDCQDDLDQLFSRRQFKSIAEVLAYAEKNF